MSSLRIETRVQRNKTTPLIRTRTEVGTYLLRDSMTGTGTGRVTLTLTLNTDRYRPSLSGACFACGLHFSVYASQPCRPELLVRLSRGMGPDL